MHLLNVVKELGAYWGGLVTVLAAAWILWLFILRREAVPGSELELDVDFVGRQDGKWLIEVVGKLTNRSAVRNWYHNFRVVVRYFLPSDQIVDGPAKLNYQLLCLRSIDERIQAQRYFANASYIDPHLTFRHTYITYVPEAATFVWVQAQLQYSHREVLRFGRRIEAVKNAQRLFKVPSESSFPAGGGQKS